MNDYQSLCSNQRKGNSVNTPIFMIKNCWKMGLVALGWGASGEAEGRQSGIWSHLGL